MSRLARHFYEFDAFRIDVEDRQLLRDGEPVPLTPKVFDILLALVENSGHTLGKDELMQKIWADSFVEEGNLNRNISTLRKILGDDSHRQRFIKTSPKRGYRFVGDVREIWEEDRMLKVENRTRLYLGVREEIVKEGKESRRHLRFYLAAAVLLLIAVSVSALVWNQSRKSEASAMRAAYGTENAEALELYRRGRALWQTRNGASLHDATVLLEQAIARDPNFARAHAALADAYAFDYTNWKKAEDAAREAIRLDPNLGEPHATIGFVRMFWQWRLHEAEAEFKQAVSLSPNYATAHQWYAALLSAVDRRDAAYTEIKQALELEPDSVAVNADLCQTLYFMRRYDEAAGQCEKTLSMDAGFLNAHRYLYEIYSAKGMHPEAVARQVKIQEIHGVKSQPGIGKKLREAFQTGGARAYWQMRIDALKSNPGHYYLAQYHARLGEKDEALKWLRSSAEKREFEFMFFFADPVFDAMRGEPDYNELINLLLPPEN